MRAVRESAGTADEGRGEEDVAGWTVVVVVVAHFFFFFCFVCFFAFLRKWRVCMYVLCCIRG